MKKERLPTYAELQKELAAIQCDALACTKALNAYYHLDKAFRLLNLECHGYLGQLMELEANSLEGEKRTSKV